MDELIAVTGASGWIGGAVCAWLESQGKAVRRLVRSPQSAAEAKFDLGDAQHARGWPEALRGCTAVIHCAAHVHRPTETEAERRKFEETNATGTGRLLDACDAAGIGRFVLASTMAVYGWKSPGPRGEEDAPAPETAYARSKLEAEQRVRAWAGDGRIARLATVYGAGDRANFKRLVDALRRRRFLLPGDGRARKSVLPVGRAAELLGRLALLDGAAGARVNLAAPDAPSLAEICEGICGACGFPAPRRVPAGILAWAGRAGDLVARLGGRAPITTEVLEKLTTTTVVQTSRMEALFNDVRWETFAESMKGAADYYGRA